jgi:hypothetical protein
MSLNQDTWSFDYTKTPDHLIIQMMHEYPCALVDNTF